MKPLSLQPFDILSRSEIAAALDNLSRASVAVLGDFCLDVYWTIDRTASEISVETGLPTEPVRSQHYSPGGAGNVVMNLLALGVQQIFPVGVLGDDPFGHELRRLLNNVGVETGGLLQQSEGWATHTYVKPHVEDSELNRIDFGNYNKLSEATEQSFLAGFEEIVNKVSVVLINHQAIGSLHDSPSFREGLAALIRRHPEVCFIVDSRGYHGAFAGAVHKLNDREVMRACGVAVEATDVVTLEDLVVHVEKLYALWKSPLVVTRGERGCLVFSGEVPWQIFGVQLPGRTDPVGAGDTFVATLAAITSTGTNLTAAACVANIAAAVTAQKLFQTGSASPDEILELGSNADYTYRPELAEAPHRAQHLDQSEIEIVAEPGPAMNIRHAIFDHDGTISTLREGWEQIMEPMMLRAVLGTSYKTADETLFHRVKSRVRDFIERTTGIQTITQMHGLVDLVREFALVPEDRILSPAGYKEIYNDELKALVNLRLAKLDRGELAVSDFTLKGAVPFLRTLHQSGVRLYLASGTDEKDVKHEAALLGYADVFAGGIYGSVGQVTKDAKKIVIERILHEVEGAFEQLAAFGDGPVEMRETTRRGAYTIGVASDEVRRFGMNLEKRARLIRSGAHVIVPDFSQWKTLWKFLRFPELKTS
ncbi:MAG: PfkB family carbohydrate kinase [Terrimicrobiaceae bacterium]|nr:PfkB family carbohydrate kinase [Terrimicrobiaceae bacterium]